MGGFSTKHGSFFCNCTPRPRTLAGHSTVYATRKCHVLLVQAGPRPQDVLQPVLSTCLAAMCDGDQWGSRCLACM